MATGSVSLTIDASEVNANLAKIIAKAPGMKKHIQNEVGTEVLRLSQKEVPHDIGTLANTGVVESDDNETIVGYNTPYAARLHEHPEYNFQKGRKGKYLEDPIKNNISGLTKVAAIAAKDKIL